MQTGLTSWHENVFRANWAVGKYSWADSSYN